MARSIKMKDYYINDKEFTKAVSDYVIANQEYIKTHNHRLTPNNYIGDSILKIAKRLSKSPNFINYSWSSDMIDEAVFLSCKYIDRFNPYIDEYEDVCDENGNVISKKLISRKMKEIGAFNYFTTIAYNAFRMIIGNEKKRIMAKKKLLENDILNRADYLLVKSGDGENYEILSMYENIVNYGENESFDDE